MKLSDCCDAPERLHDICSECGEWAEFYEEDAGVTQFFRHLESVEKVVPGICPCCGEQMVVEQPGIEPDPKSKPTTN